MTALAARLRTRGRRSRRMVVDWRQPARFLPTRGTRLALAVCALVWLVLPLWRGDNELTILSYAGAAAIGAIGLNILTGYTGQLSLGHAFSFAVGAYGTHWLATTEALPIEVWLPAVAALGAIAGLLIGPIALRVRGDYLAIVTLGLVFVGQYVWLHWHGLTGGPSGTSITGAIPAFDGPRFELLGGTYSRAQGMFWMIWAFAALAVLLARNLIRSRPGRALQAVRDHDFAAEALGVSLPRYKVGAFVIASSFAAVAGALYGVLQVAVQPSEMGLTLSIQYVGMILIGGLGSISGSVIGALFLGSLPPLIQEVTLNYTIPWVPVASLDAMLYGALIVVFVLIAPRGIAAWIARISAFISSWPLSQGSNKIALDQTEDS